MRLLPFDLQQDEPEQLQLAQVHQLERTARRLDPGQAGSQRRQAALPQHPTAFGPHGPRQRLRVCSPSRTHFGRCHSLENHHLVLQSEFRTDSASVAFFDNLYSSTRRMTVKCRLCAGMSRKCLGLSRLGPVKDKMVLQVKYYGATTGKPTLRESKSSLQANESRQEHIEKKKPSLGQTARRVQASQKIRASHNPYQDAWTAR